MILQKEKPIRQIQTTNFRFQMPTVVLQQNLIRLQTFSKRIISKSVPET